MAGTVLWSEVTGVGGGRDGGGRASRAMVVEEVEVEVGGGAVRARAVADGWAAYEEEGRSISLKFGTTAGESLGGGGSEWWSWLSCLLLSRCVALLSPWSLRSAR